MSCVCSAFYSPYTAVVLNRLGNRRALCGNYQCPMQYRRLVPRHAAEKRAAGPGSIRGERRPVRSPCDCSTIQGSVTARTALPSRIPRYSPGETAHSPCRSTRFDRMAHRTSAGHNLLLLEVTAPGIDRFCFQEPTDFNMAYWAGYVDAAHPAVFTLRLNRIWQNACRLIRPPALVNEPFATSVQTSTALQGRKFKDRRPPTD